MAEVEMTDQGGPFTHLDELVRFANSTIPAASSTPPRLLDLRCGTGSLIRAFAPYGWEAVGVDSSINLTTSALDRQPNSMSAEFLISGPETEIDLREQHFDLVVAFDDMADMLLEAAHFERFANLAADVLSPGGHLVFQLERTTAFSQIESNIETLLRCGFESAWRTTPVDMSQQIPPHLEHRGTRDLFVARRNS